MMRLAPLPGPLWPGRVIKYLVEHALRSGYRVGLRARLRGVAGCGGLLPSPPLEKGKLTVEKILLTLSIACSLVV